MVYLHLEAVELCLLCPEVQKFLLELRFHVLDIFAEVCEKL